jgi:serine/threonine-protein kinase
MGAVYAATQEDLGRRVAVKVLLPHLAERPELITRFKREALAAGALGHPNIVQVTDFSDAPGQAPFIVMEHLEGETLGARLTRETTITQERAVFIVSQILSALEAAHAAGIVHRDLKPENIYLTAIEGVPDVVKVLDFGLAKSSQSQEPTLTATGAVMGTPAYMAPEQVEGGSITAATDLYAVGALMYRALSGRLPHTAENHYALMYAIVQQMPVSISTLRPDLDDGLTFIIERAMAKDPSERFASAQAMRAALSNLGPGASLPVIASPPRAGAGAGTDSNAPTLMAEHGPASPAAHAPPAHAHAPPTSSVGSVAGHVVVGTASSPGSESSSGALKIVIAVLTTVIVMLGAGALWIFWPRGGDSLAASTSSSPTQTSVAPKPASPEPVVTAAPEAAEQVTAEPIVDAGSPDDQEAAPGEPAPPSPEAEDSASSGGLFGGFGGFGDEAEGDSSAAEPQADPEPEPEPEPPTPDKDPDTSPTNKKKKKKKKKTPDDDAPKPEPDKEATGGTKPRLSSINARSVLDLKTIKATLATVQPKVTSCYVRHEFSKGHHEFQGWKLKVDGSGKITKIDPMGTSERSVPLDLCMTPFLRKLDFGPTKTPDGGVIDITYTARLPWNP